MLIAVLSGFLLSIAAPLLHRFLRSKTGWIIALLPLGLTIYFSTFAKSMANGEAITYNYEWIPSLGVTLSFYLDGLSLTFAMLISGIGSLVMVYAGGYLSGHAQLGRFYLFILMFMASMLGLVLSNNVISLFVFWELTSLSSYFLIGFDHDRETARSAALQALIVTGLGGLALLAGMLLLAQVGESFEISGLFGQGEMIRNHALYIPILILILAGAFTKSAQVPFHFWLPSAMEAPTPVSAYLHSATMVKAGVYLLARLSPVLGDTDIWMYTVFPFGALTMLVGAGLALQQTDLKRILAYSTVSVLGMLTMLLGLDTNIAVKAAMVYLLAHALYKGALFLVAGALDHETGARDINKLSGLYRAMPITTMAAALAAISMAGFPPLFGFIGKEMLYEAALHGPWGGFPVSGVALLSSILLLTVAAIVGIKPFFGRMSTTPKQPHEAPVSLWVGPMLLAGTGLLAGLFPGPIAKSLLSPAVASILMQPTSIELALWHGLNPSLFLSLITVAGGLTLYAKYGAVQRVASHVESVSSRFGPEHLYDMGINGLNSLARVQTRILQNGYLRYYLLMIIATTILLAGYTMLKRGILLVYMNISDVRFYESGLAILILLAALAAVKTTSRLGAVVALGVVGYGVALIFILFGAPDLAMTQIMIETLTVILLVLVFYHLPRFFDLSSSLSRLRDALISLTVGALMTTLVLVAVNVQFYPVISEYFAEHSLSEAHGHNIVNVILVDFRALDTLGEITVLALAGVGVYSLLKLRLQKGEE
jgi:multicomponent Na+:H+ antiporter subunit A